MHQSFQSSIKMFENILRKRSIKKLPKEKPNQIIIVYRTQYSFKDSELKNVCFTHKKVCKHIKDILSKTKLFTNFVMKNYNTIE